MNTASVSQSAGNHRPPERGAAMTGLDYLNGLLSGRFPPPMIAPTSDIWPVSFEVGAAVFEGRPSERFYNPMGIVHGGWLSTLLDTAMGCAVHSTLESGQSFTTIELKTVFVRPVTEQTGPVTCEGRLLHAGRRVAHAEGKIVDAAGNLIAYGSESCLLLNPAAQRSGSNGQTNGTGAQANHQGGHNP